MRRLLNRPAKADSIETLNIELEKIYDLINELTLRSTKFDDSRSPQGKPGDIRISKSDSGVV